MEATRFSRLEEALLSRREKYSTPVAAWTSSTPSFVWMSLIAALAVSLEVGHLDEVVTPDVDAPKEGDVERHYPFLRDATEGNTAPS